tara:strand:+ start:391 stop:831 length:441 start_codon:yes stop_codon:yes gene_type:complete
MDNEFYASVKLVSGEELFSVVSVEEGTDNPLIMLQSPVTMKMVSTPEGSIVKVKTWMNIPGDDPIVIRWDKVITVTEIKDPSVITIYNNYLEDERYDINQIGEVNKTHRNDVKNKLTNKMGYISTVDDARKYLEGVYKIKKDKKES